MDAPEAFGRGFVGSSRHCSDCAWDGLGDALESPGKEWQPLSQCFSASTGPKTVHTWDTSCNFAVFFCSCC